MSTQPSNPTAEAVTDLPWAMQARVSLMLARSTRDPFDREQRMLDYRRALSHLKGETEIAETSCVVKQGRSTPALQRV